MEPVVENRDFYGYMIEKIMDKTKSLPSRLRDGASAKLGVNMVVRGMGSVFWKFPGALIPLTKA